MYFKFLKLGMKHKKTHTHTHKILMKILRYIFMYVCNFFVIKDSFDK